MIMNIKEEICSHLRFKCLFLLAGTDFFGLLSESKERKHGFDKQVARQSENGNNTITLTFLAMIKDIHFFFLNILYNCENIL